MLADLALLRILVVLAVKETAVARHADGCTRDVAVPVPGPLELRLSRGLRRVRLKSTALQRVASFLNVGQPLVHQRGCSLCVAAHVQDLAGQLLQALMRRGLEGLHVLPQHVPVVCRRGLDLLLHSAGAGGALALQRLPRAPLQVQLRPQPVERRQPRAELLRLRGPLGADQVKGVPQPMDLLPNSRQALRDLLESLMVGAIRRKPYLGLQAVRKGMLLLHANLRLLAKVADLPLHGEDLVGRGVDLVTDETPLQLRQLLSPVLGTADCFLGGCCAQRRHAPLHGLLHLVVGQQRHAAAVEDAEGLRLGLEGEPQLSPEVLEAYGVPQVEADRAAACNDVQLLCLEHHARSAAVRLSASSLVGTEPLGRLAWRRLHEAQKAPGPT
mmetsp:Transcript_96029/g.271531  ORF Transcript_96029/g.271531 Transcript_96029/m.271531 type:complete len:385 (+) Transcript_96029:734-1888(+)